MIDALSNRSAGNVAYRATDAETVAKPPAGPQANSAPQSDLAESPAVVKTLSPAAEQFQRHVEEYAAEASPTMRPYSDEYLETKRELLGLNSQIRRLDTAKAALPERQAQYDQLLKTQPKAATEVTGDAKTAAFKILSERGHGLMGDTTSFDHEGTRYTFHKDGTVFQNKTDVPTSEEEKRSFLDMLGSQVKLGRTDTSNLLSQRDTLAERLTALEAQRVSG